MDAAGRLESWGKELWPVALAALIALVAPLGALDETAELSVLAGSSPTTPFEHVFVATVTADDVRANTCGAGLAALVEARPLAVLLVPPADALCVPPAGAKVRRVDGSLLAVGRTGVVAGMAATDRPELRELGFGAAELGAMGPPGRVPSVRLGDLAGGRVPKSVITGRVVLVGADDPAWSETYEVQGGARVPAATAIAGAIGAHLEGGARQPAPRVLAALIAAVAALVLLVVRRRFGGAVAGASLAALLVVLHVAHRLLGSWFRAGLLPEASMALAVAVALGVASIVSFRRRDALRSRATDLVQRGALFRPIGTDEARDPRFWDRLASFVAQVHPVLGVALYERVPGTRALARRAALGLEGPLAPRAQLDLASPPFDRAHDGAEPLAPCLVDGFFANAGDDGTVVTLPLTTRGQVVGCAVLVGADARDSFAEAPEQTSRLGRELSLLVETRRAHEEAEPAAHGDRSEAAFRALSDVAALGADDRKRFAAILDRAPVGLLFADGLGDVRVLGGLFNEVLGLVGVKLETAGGAPIRPGTIGLVGVVSALTGQAPAVATRGLAPIVGGTEPVRFEVRVGEEETRFFALEISSLRGESVEEDRSGYLGTLVETTAQQARLAASSEALSLFRVRAADICMAIQGLALFEDAAGLKQALPRLLARTEELMDALASFAPAVESRVSNPGELSAPFSLLNVARSAVALAGVKPRAVTLDAPIAVDAVVGRRADLLRALRAVLEHTLARPSVAPVLVTIREWRNHVELTIVDPAYGAPAAVLASLDASPDEAPADVAPLGELLAAARRSGGEAHLLGDAGVGATLTLRLPKQGATPGYQGDFEETRAF